MKNLILNVTLALFVSSFVVGQEADSVELNNLKREFELLKLDYQKLELQTEQIAINDSVRADQTDSITESKFDEILKVLKDDLDTNIIIGEIRLTERAKHDKLQVLTKNVTPYKYKVSKETCDEFNNKNGYTCFDKKRTKKRHVYITSSDSVNISKVNISISNSAINSIQIYTKQGHVFRNGSAPINLNRINRAGDILTCRKDRKIYSIDLSDIIQFDEGVRFYPKDSKITLTKKDSVKPLTKAVGLNSLVNVRVFTDALGLLDQESNGLVQTEADFSIPLHRRNVRNKYKYWFSDVNFKAQFSKLDSKYKYTSVDTVTNTLSRINLNQRRWFNAEIGLNLVKGNFTKRSENSYTLEMIAGLNASSIANNGDSSSYVLPYFGLNPKIHLASSSNFGIDLALPFYSEIFPAKQTDSFGKPMWFFSPNLEVYYNTFGNKSSRIFGRIGYTTLTQTRGDYFILQLGYTVSITDKLKDKLKK